MSKFDDNPFGEPMVDNPFADPSTQQQQHPTAQAARTVNQNSAILDDYNPFEHEDRNRSATTASQYTTGASNPLTASSQQQQQQVPSQFPAFSPNAGSSAPSSGPAYGSASGGGGASISTAELQRRQEELDRKAAELERREAELRTNSSETRRNNWPPFPDKCCFQPCFYQDINVEIPVEFQRIVRHLYYLWSFYALIMAANVLGGMILMFHSAKIVFFFMSIIYACIFTPASFLCWYRPAYKAFRTDSSFNFMVFFFVFFFQLIVLVIQTIGINDSGYSGFITAISQFDGTPSGIIVGLFLLAIAISFAACTAGNLLLLMKIHSIYRSSDQLSMTKAQAEFSTGFIQNQHVQRAAANATSAAVSSQFGSSTNRY